MPSCPVVFRANLPEDEVPQPRWTNQLRVPAGDLEVGLRQGYLGIVDQRRKERPPLIHRAEDLAPVGEPAHERFQRGPKAVPRRQAVTGLGPGEHPGDGAELLDAAGPGAPAVSRAEPQALDQIDRRRLKKVPEESRRLVDEPPVLPPAHLRQRLGDVFPLCEMSLPPRIPMRSGQEMTIQDRCDELLDAPEGNGRVRIPLRDDFALLGDPDAASGGGVRLRPDTAVRWRAAPVDGPADAVEEGQPDAATVRHPAEGFLRSVERDVRGEVAG